MKTFVELYKKGKVGPNDIDDYISEWHNNDSTESLHDFLGLTREEYSQWVQTNDLTLAMSEKTKNE